MPTERTRFRLSLARNRPHFWRSRLSFGSGIRPTFADFPPKSPPRVLPPLHKGVALAAVGDAARQAVAAAFADLRPALLQAVSASCAEVVALAVQGGRGKRSSTEPQKLSGFRRSRVLGAAGVAFLHFLSTPEICWADVSDFVQLSRPSLAWNIALNSHHFLPDSVQSWPEFNNIWAASTKHPISADVRPILNKFGPRSTKFGRARPDLARLGQSKIRTALVPS